MTPAPDREPRSLEQALAEYDRLTDLIPLGHENIERGASTYNWRKAIVREIRALAFAAEQPTRREK